MPVYGAETTIETAVKSIIGQTLTSWELLAVDDGSPDRSGEILDRIASTDPRIHVIHQNNGGVAAARQAGLDRACGSYAIHIDPDDWIEPDMLEALVAEARSTGADMVVCDFFEDRKDKSILVRQAPSTLTPDSLSQGLFQQLHGSCWNKLISSAYSSMERFTPGLNLSEDLLYICKILSHQPRIAYLPRAFYHYRISTSGTMSTTYTAARFRQLRDIYNQLESIYQNKPTILREVKKCKIKFLGYVGICAKDMGGSEFRKSLGGLTSIPTLLSTKMSLPRKIFILVALLGGKSISSYVFGYHL